MAGESKGVSYLFLGGGASMMAATCTHPLDLLKVRMQTYKSIAGTKSPGLMATGLNVVKGEGIGGLYRGLTASLLRQATYSTARFASYEFIKNKITSSREDDKLALYERILVAMAAGGLGGIIGTPADVANVRMQDDGRLAKHLRRNYKNAFDALYRMARTEGITSWYSGLGPNINRAMLMTAGQIASYDTFKQLLLKTDGLFEDNLVTHFTASTLAGVVATLVTQPVDVIKTRLMAAPPGTYASAASCGLGVVRQEGLAALYKGTLPAFTRLGPQTILTFVFLEQLRKLHALL